VVSRVVSFHVHNTNNSLVPCLTDGAGYTITGHLVGTAAELDAPAAVRAVVLDIHGLGYGQHYWRFQSVAGYDWTADLAARGIASVTVDRLGYGGSGHPAGTETCFGAHADMAHQVIQALRAGSYAMDGGTGLRFARVGLTGHSVGGAIVQIEAYSFHDIDALLVLSFADLVPSVRAFSALGASALRCLGGGSPPGYAPFGQNDADFQALMFHDADPGVVAAATRLRNPDPCGDYGSAVTTIAADILHVHTINVPALLAIGDHDVLFPSGTVERQKGLYTGTSDVTAVSVANSGHALQLERSAPASAAATASWLCARSFCASGV
jgi:pimeloyl-ACP methyl ester carboxylesterase